MRRIALVQNNLIAGVFIYPDDVALPDGMVEIASNVGRGWTTANGGTSFTAPAPPAATYRTRMTRAEWVLTWTDEEWAVFKTLSATNNAAGRRLARTLDAIQRADYVDVADQRITDMYAYAVAQGWITQQRATALLLGIQE